MLCGTNGAVEFTLGIANSMTIDSQKLDTLLKWFGVGIGWLISTYITYRIGRKTKHDDMQIGKRYSFAEQLSALLQRDFHSRQKIAEQYHSNFDNLDNVSKAVDYFNKHNSCYQSMNQLISELPNNIGKLQEANRSAAIYLDESTTKAIESYIANTSFSYETDGDLGLINTYAENFFVTLLDLNRSKRLTENYNSAMRGLRKAVR